jgi:hypothetical protein
MNKNNEDQEVQAGYVGTLKATEGTLVAMLAGEIPDALERADAFRQAGDLDSYNEVITAMTQKIHTNREPLMQAAKMVTAEGASKSLQLLGRRAMDALSTPTAGGRPPATEADMAGGAAIGAYAVLNNSSVRTAKLMNAGRVGTSSMYQDEFIFKGEQFASVNGGSYRDFRRTKGEAYIQHGLKWERVFQDQYGRGGAPVGMGRELARTASNGFMLGSDPTAQNAATVGLFDLATALSSDPARQSVYMHSINQAVDAAITESMDKDPATEEGVPGSGFAMYTDDGIVPTLLSTVKNSIKRGVTADGLQAVLQGAMSNYARARKNATASGIAFNRDHLSMFAELAVDRAVESTSTGRVELSKPAAVYKRTGQAVNNVRAKWLTRSDKDPQARAVVASVVQDLMPSVLSAVLEDPGVFEKMGVSQEEALEAYMNFSEDSLAEKITGSGKSFDLGGSPFDEVMTTGRLRAVERTADRMNATMGTNIDNAKVRVRMDLAGLSPDDLASFNNLDKVVNEVAYKGITAVNTAGEFELPKGTTPMSIAATARELLGDGVTSPLGDLKNPKLAPTKQKLEGIIERVAQYEAPVTEREHLVRDIFTQPYQERLEGNPELVALQRQWRSLGSGVPGDDIRKRTIIEQRDAILGQEREATLDSFDDETRVAVEDALGWAGTFEHLPGKLGRGVASAAAGIYPAGGGIVLGGAIKWADQQKRREMPTTLAKDLLDGGNEFNFDALDSLYKTAGPSYVTSAASKVAGAILGPGTEQKVAGRTLYAQPEALRTAFKELNEVANLVKSGNNRTQGRLRDLEAATGASTEDMTRLVGEMRKQTAGMTVIQAREEHLSNALAAEKQAMKAGEYEAAGKIKQTRQKISQATTLNDIGFHALTLEDNLAVLRLRNKGREAGVIANAKYAAKAANDKTGAAPVPDEIAEEK